MRRMDRPGARKKQQRRLLSLWTLLGVLLLTACGRSTSADTSSGSTVVRTATSPATTIVAGILSNIHMIDASNGWAISHSIEGTSYRILRTTDGGVHWQMTLECRPTQGVGRDIMEPCSTDFRSASVATVVQPEYESATQYSQIRIFHTSNGGQTWQSSLLQVRDLETPAVFVDGTHGWVFATDHFPGPDPASAYIGGEIALYHTSDGGASWQRIASGPSTPQIATTTDDAYGAPPFAASARMQFLTPSTGWLIGMAQRSSSSSYSWLYVTHDGGSTWHKVAISFPTQMLSLWTPTFFSGQDGLFPVLTNTSNAPQTQGTLLYTTRDGGQSWTPTTVPLDITNAIFTDLNHAVADNPVSNILYTTSDGWHHWTQVQMHAPFKRLYALDFVSPTLGWALADNRTLNHTMFRPKARSGDVVHLVQTTDGGQTWHEIAHSRA